MEENIIRVIRNSSGPGITITNWDNASGITSAVIHANYANGKTGYLFGGTLNSIRKFSVDESGDGYFAGDLVMVAGKTLSVDDIDLDGSITMDASETVDGIDVSAHIHNAVGTNGAKITYSNLLSIPGTFTPSSHTHPSKGNVTGTANRAAQFNSSGNLVASSTISTTELGYLNAVSSGIQGQLNGKALSSTQIIAGTSLTGGGSLASSRTINHVNISAGDHTNMFNNGANNRQLFVDARGHVTIETYTP